MAATEYRFTGCPKAGAEAARKSARKTRQVPDRACEDLRVLHPVRAIGIPAAKHVL